MGQVLHKRISWEGSGNRSTQRKTTKKDLHVFITLLLLGVSQKVHCSKVEQLYVR